MLSLNMLLTVDFSLLPHNIYLERENIDCSLQICDLLLARVYNTW